MHLIATQDQATIPDIKENGRGLRATKNPARLAAVIASSPRGTEGGSHGITS